MIHEILEISGSHNITGSLLLPLLTEDTIKAPGSLAYQNGKTYVNDGTTWLQLAETTTLTTPIEYLVIGGGGSGGQLGGGGAGGYLSSSLENVTSGSSFTVTVGSGGAGVTSVVRGNNGTNSSIAGTGYTTVTAIGGGGGGGQGSASDAGTGKDGGSGGGGGENDAGTNTPGSGTTGQGNDGGTGGTGAGTQLSGGGGGGAGAAGSNAAGQYAGGAGGNGLTSKITGTSATRAGGGGGGAWWYNNGGSSTGGAGGSGGGGAAGTTGNTAAISGTVNTGGGGGGAGFTSAGYWITDSGNGGSGVVILAYNSGSRNSIGGHESDAGSGKKAHKFGSSGTFYIGGTTDFQIVTDDLLMHYDFANAATWNGSASTITDLQGNHNLSVNSSPTLDYTHGGGLSLDGVDDYASKESSISYTPYMAEIWLTSDVVIDTNAYTDSTYAIPLGLGLYPGGFTFGSYTGGMTNETIGFWGANYTSTGATYIRDTFSAGTYQIVANWNGSSYDIWVNGSKKTAYAVATYGNTTLHARDSIILGKEDHPSQSYEFGGRIHNVKIYNAQKTDADVTQNWNALRKRFGL